MKNRMIVLLTLLHLCLFSPLTVRAEDVRISAAASMTDAIGELAAAFTQTHPDVTILPNFGSSGALAKQIVQGAPADLFLAANREWLDFLVRKGAINQRATRICAANILVFVGRPTTHITSLADLPALQRIAMGSPKSVPAGQYAEQAMRAVGVYDEFAATGRLVLTKDVRQALLYAERGEVDGAFVYQSDAHQAKNSVILFSVPDSLHDRIVYPIALTRKGEHKKGARDFYTFWTTPAAEAILKKYGFTTPAADDHRNTEHK